MAKRLTRRFTAVFPSVAAPFFRSRSIEAAGFDPDFYRRHYADLVILPDQQALARHFIEHGRTEGRFSNAQQYISALTAEHQPLPDDFVPATYRSCHPDLGDLTQDWELSAHYLKYGRLEGRHYSWDFKAYEENYRFLPRRLSKKTFSEFLESYGMVGGAWLDRFELGTFQLLNAAWVNNRATTRIEAIILFVEEGLVRLAPIAAGYSFDPDFYRTFYAKPNVSSDALYREWLCQNADSGYYGNEGQFLRRYIGDANFPSAFDDTRYRSLLPKKHPALRNGRAAALAHYFEYGFAAGLSGVVDGHEAGALYTHLGRFFLVGNNFVLARKAFDLAIELHDDTPSLYHLRGDTLRQMKLLNEAVVDFERAAQNPDSEVWSHIYAADVLVKLNRTEAALDRVLRSANKHRNSMHWRAVAHRVLSLYFTDRGEQARSLYRLGERDRADELMLASMRRVAELLPLVDPLPVPLPRPTDGPIVLLANRDLPQCDHYRVVQKQLLLEQSGWTVEIYSMSEIEACRKALNRAQAAIFYRVPGNPAVLHAILYASALGIPTIYEIDDLIFNPAVYPDPFESFEGQISSEDYANLQHGVPQFRYAMSLCEVGLASTPTLADSMRPLVRSKIVHVLRNGLDRRNLPYLAVPWTPFSSETMTIFYGSGTKAHNQDFSELAAPALLAALTRHPQIRLLLAGHLRLDDRFLRFAERVRRLDFTTDVEAYWEVLAGVDINLAVLLQNPMSDAKSEIKWLEAAMCGVPSIVSATRTYREILIDGEDVLLADTAQDWEAALERLITDPTLRRQVGEAARKKATKCYSFDEAAAVLRKVLPAPALPSVRNAESIPVATASSKPRVLIVNVYFPPQTIGGATRVVRDNVDYILGQTSNRFELAVVTIDDEAGPAYAIRVDAYRDVPVFRIAPDLRRNMDWNPADPQMREVFEEALDRFTPDLVHFHCIQRLTGAIVEAVQARGLPYLVTVHDAWWISDHQFLVDEEGVLRMPTTDPCDETPKRDISATASIARRRRLGRALAGASKILAVSDTFAQLYRDAGFHDTIAVPNGVSCLGPVARITSPQGRVRLGHIGGRSAHKGVTLIEHVLRSSPYENLMLTLVDHAFGTDYVRDEVWGTTPVRVVGRVSQDRISDLYANLDVLLAPSIWPESFGLVTREARQAGMWVVASNRGAIGEDITEGVDGFRVDVGTPNDLQIILKRMDTEPARFLVKPPESKRPIRTSADQGAELIRIYEGILQNI